VESLVPPVVVAVVSPAVSRAALVPGPPIFLRLSALLV